jgi:hypothetical protein
MSRATLKPIVSNLRESIIKGIAGKLEKFGFDENGVLVIDKPLSEYDETIRNNLIAYFEAKQVDNPEKYTDYIHNTSRTLMHILVCFKLMEKRGIMGLLLERVIDTDIYNEIIPDFVNINPIAFDEFISKYANEIMVLAKKDFCEEDDEYYQFICLMELLTREMSQEVPLLFKEYEYNLIQPDYDDLREILKVISSIDKSEYEEDDFLGWIYQYWVDTDDNELEKAKENSNISFGNYMLYRILQTLSLVQTEFGEFYTPREVVKKIVDNSIEMYRENNERSVEDIKLIDPACGAGNFLVYAFDVFKNMYDREHPDWTEDKKISSILERNIYGADIQREPLQITALNLWIKAKGAAYNANVKKLHLYNVNVLKANSLYRWEKEEEFHQISLFDTEETMHERKFSSEDIGRLLISREEINRNSAIYFFNKKYEIVVMNPPYLGIRKMKKENADFLKEYYPNNYINLFEAFVVRALEILVKNGVCGYVSSNTFLTLSSHESIRSSLLTKTQIRYLENVGNVFDGPTVNASIMIIKNCKPNSESTIVCIHDNNKILQKQSDFKAIKGYPIIEGISNNIIQHLKKVKGLGEYVLVKQGMISGDNKRFLRYKWQIPDNLKGNRFFPYANGGGYSKYANDIIEYIDWEDDGKLLKADAKRKYGSESRTIKNVEFFFREGLTYSEISGNAFSARYYPSGCIFSNKGPCIFSDDFDNLYLLGFTNSKYFNYVAKLLNPTVGFAIGDIERIPFIQPDEISKSKIIDYAKKILEDKRFIIGFNYISDFYQYSEIEYGFLQGAVDIQDAYNKYRIESETRIMQISEKASEIDQMIYTMYGLSEEEITTIENSITGIICDEKQISSYDKACLNFLKAVTKDCIKRCDAKLYTSDELIKLLVSEIERNEKYGYKLIEDIEQVLKQNISAIITNGAKIDGSTMKFTGRSNLDIQEPILISKTIAGSGKNKIDIYWASIQFLIEFEENKRYVMQNEIRRLTNEVYVPKLQRAKEKLQLESQSVCEQKSLEKEIELYEECVKTLENWKVVE